LAAFGLVVGCSERTSRGGDDDGSNNGLLNNGPNNGTNGQNNGADAGQDDVGSNNGQDDGGANNGQDDVGPMECQGGDRRCEGDGRLSWCNGGRWQTEACLPGESCREPGECFPDATQCVAGQLICLEADQPAECDTASGSWRPLNRCGADQACVAGQCRSRACADAANSASYLGCDYLATDIPNIAFGFGSTPDAPIGVVLTNPSPTEAVRFSALDTAGQVAPLVAEVTIGVPLIVGAQYTPVSIRTEIRDSTGQLAFASFDQARNLEIPPLGMAVLLMNDHGYTEQTVVRPWAFDIQTDRPVAAYQFSPYCCNYSFTNDASLLFPTSTLGREYIFLGVPSWSAEGTGYPAIMTIIGTEAGTELRVDLPPGASVQPDTMGRVQVQGQQVTATLGRNEVLHLMTTAPGFGDGVDLSGARITASRPISVFSAHLCTNYPADREACDHLEEQLFPLDTWGLSFGLVPTKLRAANLALASEATYWKIVAADNDTAIELSVDFNALDPMPPGFSGVPDCRSKLDGARRIRLNAGEHCEFGTRSALKLDATGPIMVMGVISGQATTGYLQAFGAHAGDPAIFLVPPQRQYRTEYAFLAPTTYFVDYLTVVTDPGAYIELDGVAVDLSDASPIPGATQIYKHVLIEDGPHRVTSTFPFGILVYAFDDYVSYAFTGGLNLIKGRGGR